MNSMSLKTVEVLERPVPGGVIRMPGNVRCTIPFCRETAAICFHANVVCVSHFIARCYEQLDAYESEKPNDRQANADHRLTFLRECSGKAVDLCLSHQGLDNLQRARLLDILLRVTDLASCFYSIEGLADEGMVSTSFGKSTTA